MADPHEQAGDAAEGAAGDALLIQHLETLSPSELAAYARVAAALNGLALSDQDLALTAAEFGRGLEIIRPLLEHELPDRLDLAGVYRP